MLIASGLALAPPSWLVIALVVVPPPCYGDAQDAVRQEGCCLLSLCSVRHIGAMRELTLGLNEDSMINIVWFGLLGRASK